MDQAIFSAAGTPIVEAAALAFMIYPYERLRDGYPIGYGT
jgi:hypothetical protein